MEDPIEDESDNSARKEVTKTPWQYGLRSSKVFVVAVITIAIFTDVFLYGMIIPILPVILRERLHLPEDQLQTWISTLLAVFGGALLIGAPILGFLADKGSSRRLPFIFGLLTIAAATIMFWLASSLVMLVIARILTGLSACAVWVVGVALIVDAVGSERAGVAFGYVSMALTIGTVAGPSLGGIILDQFGFDAVFIAALSLIALDIVLRLMMIEPQKRANRRLVSTPGESQPLLNGSSERNYEAANDTVSKTPDHLHHRRRKSSIPPIVRLAISGQLLVVLMGVVIDSILYNTFESVLPVFVIKTFNWGSLGIGLCFLPISAPALFSPVVGSIVDRSGPRLVSVFGFVLMCPVLFLLRLIQDDTPRSQALFFVLLTLAGVSFTAQIVPLMAEINHPVEKKELECPGIFGEQGATAQAYALYNVAWATGQLIGPALSGGLVEAAGWPVMVTVMGCLSVAAVLLLGFTHESVVTRFPGKKAFAG